jgi:hypothetical protein
VSRADSISYRHVADRAIAGDYESDLEATPDLVYRHAHLYENALRHTIQSSVAADERFVAR